VSLNFVWGLSRQSGLVRVRGVKNEFHFFPPFFFLTHPSSALQFLRFTWHHLAWPCKCLGIAYAIRRDDLPPLSLPF
jgi:hypothetical protein